MGLFSGQKMYSLAIHDFVDATPSSTAPAPPVGGAEEGAEVMDLSTANALIQQQQDQIHTLLQQQQQLRSQTSNLLAPALQVCVCALKYLQLVAILELQQ